MKKKTKFKMFYVYLGIILVLFGGIFALNSIESKDNIYGIPSSQLNPATRKQLNDPNYQNIILPAQFDEKVENKEDFFVYLFSSTCHYCKQTTPELMPLAKELNIDLPQLNLLEFNSYQRSLNVNYTPTLAYFKDGVEVDRMEGGIKVEGASEGYTLDQYREFFTKHAGNS
ncbi:MULTISPECIES: thioredoxin family protein [unclassified Paenibacillus]|uniref:thioredoxin family protein n=1 Tax=unclassified Paenibacillus TaxID=185978 RepID=UPI002F3E52C6